MSEKLELRPASAWRVRLAEAWSKIEPHGRKRQLMQLHGLTKSAVGRATNVRRDDESVSYDVYERLRRAVNGELAGAGNFDPLPEPFVAVVDEEERRWVDLGRQLRAADDEYYQVLVAAIAERGQHAAAQREAELRIASTLNENQPTQRR